MRIFDETKTYELSKEKINLETGYLKRDKLLVHHDAVIEQKAVYKDRTEKLSNGSTQTYKDLVMPAVEAKAAYDEEEDIMVYIPYTAEEIAENKKTTLRARREVECYPYINRGELWYETLTAAQRAELQKWYAEWLNVTETLVVPEKPAWLK